MGTAAFSASLKSAESETRLLEGGAALLSFGMPSSRQKQNWDSVNFSVVPSH